MIVVTKSNQYGLQPVYYTNLKTNTTILDDFIHVSQQLGDTEISNSRNNNFCL